MLQEFKIFLKIQNLLLENSNLTLNESTEIAQEILDIIEQYNKKMEGKIYKDGTFFTKLEINTDLSNIQKVDTGEEEDTLTIRTNGKNQQIKIGRLLRQLLPNAKNEDIENLFYKIKEIIMEKKNILNDYEFEIVRDITKWYKYFEENNLDSCMTRYEVIYKKVLELYELDDTIKLLLIKNKIELIINNNEILKPGTIIGRALIWYNTSLGKPFIDRLYVHKKLNYMDIYNVMALWAKKNNYAYRGPGRDDKSINNSSSTIIKYQIPEKIWEKIDYLPYMDTLYHLDFENKILTNSEEEILIDKIIDVQNSYGLKIIYLKDKNLADLEWVKNFQNNIEEIEIWKEYFDDPNIAGELFVYFSDPEEAYNWYYTFKDIGTIEKWYIYFKNDLDIAFVLYKNFKKPKIALKWLKSSFLTQEEKENLYNKYYKEDIISIINLMGEWYKVGWENPELAYHWYNSGWVNPKKALELFNNSFKKNKE